MSVMAAVRLDDKPDKIDRALMVSLLDGGPLCWKRSIEFTSDPLASTTWQEVLRLILCSLWFTRHGVRNKLEHFMFVQVSPQDTLITPVQCKSIWRQFKAETEYPVAQAILMQVYFPGLFFPQKINKYLPGLFAAQVLIQSISSFITVIYVFLNGEHEPTSTPYKQ